MQSGFTDYAVNFKGDVLNTASFVILGLGQLDLGTISQRSFAGWYWGALPAFVIGLWLRWLAGGIIHISDRPKQAKKPLHKIMTPKLAVTVAVYMLILLGLLGASVYFILRETSTVE